MSFHFPAGLALPVTPNRTRVNLDEVTFVGPEVHMLVDLYFAGNIQTGWIAVVGTPGSQADQDTLYNMLVNDEPLRGIAYLEVGDEGHMVMNRLVVSNVVFEVKRF